VKSILLLNTYYYPHGKGGAEKSTKLIAEAFVLKGYKVSVITTCDQNSQKNINGVSVYYLNMGNIYWLPYSKRFTALQKTVWHLIDSFGLNDTNELEKTLKQLNPDIVLTNNLVQFSSKVWRLLSGKQIPIIHILRDHYQLSMKTTVTERMTFIEKWILGRFLSIKKKTWSKKVDYLIGISDYIINKHLEYGYFKNARIKRTIYNPTSIQEGLTLSSSKRRPVFGYMGALNKNKGVDLLIWEFSHNKIDNELLIFGDGTEDYLDKLRKISEKHAHIKYMGYEKPEEIFKKIDCLIVPSLINEAFGRVIIEAYSFGIPVIGSNRGGIPELIDNSYTGYIFNPDDRNALYLIIKNNNLDKHIDLQLKLNSYKKSMLFSTEAITNQYIMMLDEIEQLKT
jgi:glycosyltransferase involved in cell wall biosynthesis